MIRWLSHAFWYTLIAAFVIATVVALAGLVVSILRSLVTIALYAPAALRNRRRERGQRFDLRS